MNIVMNGPAVVLDRLQRLALVDAAGTVAQVKAGRLWITLENDRRDILLAPGDTWTIERDGLTLVQAEEPSTVVLSDPASARRTMLQRIGDALAAWFGRTRRAAVPYY